MGRSGEAKDRKNKKKVKCDGRTDGQTDGRRDGQTDGPTKRGVQSRSTRLKKEINVHMEKEKTDYAQLKKKCQSSRKKKMKLKILD